MLGLALTNDSNATSLRSLRTSVGGSGWSVLCSLRRKRSNGRSSGCWHTWRPNRRSASAAIVLSRRFGASLCKSGFRMTGALIGATIIVALNACFSQEQVRLSGCHRTCHGEVWPCGRGAIIGRTSQSGSLRRVGSGTRGWSKPASDRIGYRENHPHEPTRLAVRSAIGRLTERLSERWSCAASAGSKSRWLMTVSCMRSASKWSQVSSAAFRRLGEGVRRETRACCGPQELHVQPRRVHRIWQGLTIVGEP
jgi:hypothetical protein